MNTGSYEYEEAMRREESRQTFQSLKARDEELAARKRSNLHPLFDALVDPFRPKQGDKK